jgi:23S rRNA (guanosine2251-2'-O)-methyltransferase
MSSLIPGFHAIHEALVRGHVKINEIWLAEGKGAARTRKILDIAESQHIPIRIKKGQFLSSRLPHVAHQGIVAVVDKFHYSDFEAVIETSLKNPEKALLIVLDHITDEGNLGALMRTSAFFGIHGMIIPKDRSAQVTPRVLKSTAGSFAYLPVTRVVNLVRALKMLKKKGFWIVGTEVGGTKTIYEFDWERDLVLVLGNEQKGLSPSVKKSCHQLVNIPSAQDMESLNVSVAGGVILSEIIRQKSKTNI